MRFSGGMEQERSLYAAENHRHHKQLRDEIDKSPKKDEVLRPVVEIQWREFRVERGHVHCIHRSLKLRP